MRVVVEVDRWSHPACASADISPLKRRRCLQHLVRLLYELSRDMLEAVERGLEVGRVEVEGEVVRLLLGSSGGGSQASD